MGSGILTTVVRDNLATCEVLDDARQVLYTLLSNGSGATSSPALDAYLTTGDAASPAR
jgi:hypothetical protein